MTFSSRFIAMTLCGLLVGAAAAHAQTSAPATTVAPVQTGTTTGAISNEAAPRLDQKKTEAEDKAAAKAKAAEKEKEKAVPAVPAVK